ncbi:hypothetical protein ACA910_014596 [Epithemia clementina (nom. ined.)]
MRDLGAWDKTLGDEENDRYGSTKLRRSSSHDDAIIIPPTTDESNFEDDDDDDNSTDSSEDDSEDRLVEERLWDKYLATPPNEPPVLCLHEMVALNEKSLDRLIGKMSSIPERDRPHQIQLRSKRISDTIGTAYRVDQLIELCKENLRSLDIQNSRTSPDGSEDSSSTNNPYAKQVYSEVLGSTIYLEKLFDLRIHKTNLARPAALRNKLAQCLTSKTSQIMSLHITECSLHKIDTLAPALEQYAGLKELRFRDCGLNQSELHTLLDAIEKSKSCLTRLDLSLNGLENSDLPRLSSMLTAQRTLLVLELWNNHLFEKWNEEEGEYEVCNDDTGFLQVALSVHVSLQELDLANCDVDPVAFQSLFIALTENTSLLKLNMWRSCDSIRIDKNWVDCIPRIKTLRSLYGLEHLTRKKKWESIVAPALRKNTALARLAANFDLNDDDDDDDEEGDLILYDNVTTRTLARNTFLHKIAGFNVDGDPPLGIWPVLIERLGSHGVEESALFLFLQTRSAKLQQVSALSSSKRKGKKRSAISLEEENRMLHGKVQQLEQENMYLKLEKALLLNESSS